MASKFLTDLAITMQTEHLAQLEEQQQRRITEIVFENFSPLKMWVGREIFRKYSIGDPAINVFGIFLTPNPAPGYRVFEKRSIWVDVGYDPKDLLSITPDSKIYGELAIDLSSAGVERVGGFPKFPAAAFIEAFEGFRNANYTIHVSNLRFKLEQRGLVGNVDHYVDCASTWFEVSLKLGREEILRTSLKKADRVMTGEGHVEDAMKMELQGTKLVYTPCTDKNWYNSVLKDNPLSTPIEIDLEDFPNAKRRLL